MERKEICAFLIGCEVKNLLSYKDYGDQGCVAIGPDGKKYRFDNAQLGKAEARRSSIHTPKPRAKRTTKRQTATKKKTAKSPDRSGVAREVKKS